MSGKKKKQIPLLEGRYRLMEPVGRGGMSTVYRARDERTGEIVAVKMLKKQHLKNPELCARFKNEALVLSGLELEPVIRLLGFSFREPQLFLVLEYLSGATLQESFSHGYPLPLPWRDAAGLCIWLLDALRQLHARGIVHRDVKPQNIMISSTGKLTLIDFGNACRTDRPLYAKSRHAVGSVQYMSPEQLTGQPPEPRQDLYSVGVTLYQLLTGRLPFDGPDAQAVAQAVMTGRAAPLGAELPAGLWDILQRALARDPAGRYPSAGAMEQDLRDILVDPTQRFGGESAHRGRGLFGRARRALARSRTAARQAAQAADAEDEEDETPL